MKCPRCGNEVKEYENEKYCSKCGFPINTPANDGHCPLHRMMFGKTGISGESSG